MTAPRAGTRGTYHLPGKPATGFTVHRVEDSMCWAIYDHHTDGKPSMFIWHFKDGLNAMHDWPGKEGPIAPCPGYVRSAPHA